MKVEIEHKTVCIEINDSMQREMDKLTAEGWVLIPEIKPVAVYQLVRTKPQQTGDAMGLGAKMEIDDRKVGLLRNGFVYWPDGTRSKEGEGWEKRVPYQ